MSLPYQGKLIPRAKELRKDATKQENHLWYDFLRGYPMRFQRQKTIDGFIADFYCHVARLVVEVDGSQHYDEQGLAYDKERSAIFAEYGVKVIRFSNLEMSRAFKKFAVQLIWKSESGFRNWKILPQSKASGFASSLWEGAYNVEVR